MKTIVRPGVSMPGKLTVLALKHSTVVVILAIVVVLAGIVAVWHWPVEVTPAEPALRLQVVVKYPGHGAGEVEQAITVPIEHEMSSISGARVSSVSRTEWSIVTLSFSESTEEAAARQQIMARLAAVTLPADVSPVLLQMPQDQ